MVVNYFFGGWVTVKSLGIWLVLLGYGVVKLSWRGVKRRKPLVSLVPCFEGIPVQLHEQAKLHPE